MTVLIVYVFDIFYAVSAILLLKRYYQQVLVSAICFIVLLYNSYFIYIGGLIISRSL